MPARPGLATLFALDERLGAVVAGTTETGLGLIRLAWWREALTALDPADPPAEPLLTAVAAHILAGGIGGARLAGLEEGWAVLLDAAPDADALALHGRARGGLLFGIAGRLLGARDDALSQAGAGWALADVAHRHSDAGVRQRARALAAGALAAVAGHRWPRALRPLGALAVLAARDAGSEGPRGQGSPARVARMLVLRLTGR